MTARGSSFRGVPAMPSFAVDNFTGCQWTKLMVNQVNAMPAITGLSAQQTLGDRRLRPIITASLQEAVRVGIARGVLLVVIALVVYKTVFGGSGGIEQIDRGRSAALLGDLESRIQAMLPEDAPQWIAGQYDDLTQSCARDTDQALMTMAGPASI